MFHGLIFFRPFMRTTFIIQTDMTVNTRFNKLKQNPLSKEK